MLKEKLLDYSDKDEEALDDNQEVIKESKTFLKISYNTLFKVGITSNYGRTIALLVTFVITLYQSFKDAINAFEIDEKEVDTVFERGAGFFSAGILIFGLLVLVLLINIVRIFIKHFDFVMIKQKQSLVITSGLFAKKNTLLNPDKVRLHPTARIISEKFRILDMNMKQASSDEVKEQKKKAMRLRCRAVIQKKGMKSLELSSEKFRKGNQYRSNFRYLIFRTFSAVAFMAVILTLLHYAEIGNMDLYIPLVFVYLCLISSLIYFGYRNHALYVNQDFVIKRHGAWDVEHEIIEPHKIQAITAKQYFWHKSADVGHLILHTAAGDVDFRFGDFTHIKQLVNYWLYQVETSEKNWM